MKTKSQVSKNVTTNNRDEKRQGMKVRTVVTGHDAKGRAVFVRAFSAPARRDRPDFDEQVREQMGAHPKKYEAT
jgi:hypothetical protein